MFTFTIGFYQRTHHAEGGSASAKAGLLFKFENKTFDHNF